MISYYRLSKLRKLQKQVNLYGQHDINTWSKLWAECLYKAGLTHKEAKQLTAQEIKKRHIRLLWYPIDAVWEIYTYPPTKETYHERRVKRLTGTSHTSEEWENKKAQYNYRCAYCGKKTDRLTKDHIIPVSKGGTDFIENIVPACWPCNNKKRASPVEEFKEGFTPVLF